MAIREQTGRAKPYFVYWQNPFTKKRESASFESREEAKAYDSLIKHKLKYERDFFKREDQEQEKTSKDLTLEEATYLYLRDKQFPEKCLRDFLYKAKCFLPTYGGYMISEITKADLEKIAKSMSLEGLTPITVKRKLSCLSSVLYWAVKNEYLNKMPPMPEITGGRNMHFVPPTLDEISSMYEAAAHHIQRVLILGYYIGMRVGPSEMFRLKWSDIDLLTEVVRVPNANKGAVDPWREVPISEAVIDIIRSWREEDDESIEYVVHFKGKMVSSIKKAWAAMLKRAGISRRIRPYDLRHGFATMLLAGGADPGTVAKLMGHSNTDMIFKNYQHVLTAQKKAAVATLQAFKKGVQKRCASENQ